MSAIKEAVVRPLAKFDSTCAQLSQMAYALGPDAKMPTFANLCAQTRVSKATLDAALGQLEAQGIVLRRQGAGIFVSPQLKRSIALVCAPQFSMEPRIRSFWELIVREAQLRVAGSLYDLAFHFSTIAPEISGESTLNDTRLHAGLMDDIRANRVQGVLAVGLPLRAVEWMSAQGAAVVVFAGLGPVSVNMDSASIVQLGVEVLAGCGCRRMALWSTTGRDSGAANRDDARDFHRALAARGLKFEARRVRPQARESIETSDFDQALKWVDDAFGGPRPSWPDGLLLTNDILTRDVLTILQKRGIVPNRDITIASHANSNSPVLRAYENELILIEYDSGEIVQTMFDQLETLLRGESVLQPHIQIEPKIRPPEPV